MEHSAFLEYMKETRFYHSVQSRVDETKANRRTLRTSVALKMRNIGPMTPAIDSPVKIKIPTKSNPSPKIKLFDVKPDKKDGVSRVQKFKQWQKEKENRLQKEKGKAKPVFKVHHVEATASFNLEAIYSNIKGKPIDVFRKKNSKAEFVPIGKHKFKPPPNVVPLPTHRMNLRSKNVVSELPTLKKSGELNQKPRTELKNKMQKLVLPQKKIGSKITNSVVIGGKSLQIRTENMKADSKITEAQKKLPAVTTKIKGVSKTSNTNGTTENAVAAIQVNSNSKNCVEKTLEKYEKPTRLRRKSIRIDKNSQPSLLEIDNEKLLGVRSFKQKEVAVTAATLQQAQEIVKESRLPDKHNNRKTKQQKRNFVTIDLISSSDELPSKSEKRTKKSRRTKSTSPLMEHNKSNSSLSTAYSINSSQSDSPATPNQKDMQLTYVSPFVTMSRGKENARREHKRRSTLGGDNNTKCTSPTAAAQYFRRILEQQNQHLVSLCEKWNAYKLENQTEEVHNMINVAIGQTELLRRKKFKQFEELIEMCESGKSEKPIKSLDLHGYYDTMQIQIVNLEKRFENLEQLKSNNWEEVMSPKRSNNEKIVSSPKKAKTKKTIKQAKPTMGLRAMIAAKRKQLTSIPDVVVDAIQTPKGKRVSSLRRSVGASLKKNRISSPGLIMMKVTQDAKTRCSTPGTLPKSILKSEKKIDRNIRKSKVVLFQEDSPSPRKMLRRSSRKFDGDSF